MAGWLPGCLAPPLARGCTPATATGDGSTAGPPAPLLAPHPPANRCRRVQATQRAGRAGRTRPGTCYRLYTKKFFEREMPNTVREGAVLVYVRLLCLGDAPGNRVSGGPAELLFCVGSIRISVASFTILLPCLPPACPTLPAPLCLRAACLPVPRRPRQRSSAPPWWVLCCTSRACHSASTSWALTTWMPPR